MSQQELGAPDQLSAKNQVTNANKMLKALQNELRED